MTLSHTKNDFLVEVREGDGDDIFRSDSWENETTLKGQVSYDPGGVVNLLAGASAKVLDYEHIIWSEDTEIYDGDVDSIIVVPGSSVDIRGQTYKVGTFLHANWSPVGDRIQIRGGLRYAWFDLIGDSDVSPRVGLTVKLNERTTADVSYGLLSQAPPLSWITSSLPENSELGNFHCRQTVVEVEHLLKGDLKLTVEFYVRRS